MKKETDEIIFYGCLNGRNIQGYAYSVYGMNGLCATITTGCGGGHLPLLLDEGENELMNGEVDLIPCKLDKMPEGKLIHDINEAKVCDVGTETASTVCARYYKGLSAHKDNMCIEIKQATKEGSIKCKVGGCFDSSFPNSKTRRGRVQENGDVTPTLTASNSENINYIESKYRIRKLTPKECWRLMGYTDEDFTNAERVNSNTQLYKEAGNAIVKQVLMAIFSQMGIKNVPKWNETKEVIE